MLHKNVVIEEPGKYEGERLLVKYLWERKYDCPKFRIAPGTIDYRFRVPREGIVNLLADRYGVYELPNVQGGFPILDGEIPDSESDTCEHGNHIEDHCCSCSNCCEHDVPADDYCCYCSGHDFSLNGRCRECGDLEEVDDVEEINDVAEIDEDDEE